MSRTSPIPKRALVLMVAFLGVEACTERSLTTGPGDSTVAVAPLAQAVACRADVAAGSMTCRLPTEEPVSGLSLAVMLGGQGTFVLLASDNVSYDGSSVFQADVTVQNLIAQALATTDGTTLDPDGVRVFFHAGPIVTEGTGTVSVANADGNATFTGSNQPYFQYDELLAAGATSAAKTWQWSVPPSVTSFVFEVYVAAAVQHAEGWVTASPDAMVMRVGDTEAVNALVQDAVGRELEGVERSFATTDSDVVTVEAGDITGVGYGTAEIIVASPPCTPDTVAVVVVQTTAPELGSWQAITDFGGIVFETALSSTPEYYVSRKTLRLRDWTCGSVTVDTTLKSWGWIGDITDGEFTFSSLFFPQGDLVKLTVRGLFGAPDSVLGTWTFESPDTTCSSAWAGVLATPLYLAYDSDDTLNYLSTQQRSPSNSAWIAGFAPGDTFEWKTELGGPIEGDVYDFFLELAISAEDGPDGSFDVSLLIDDGVSEQGLVTTEFQVRYWHVFLPYEDVVRGQAGGAAGDTLILRVTFTGPPESGLGGVAFGNPSAADSQILLGGTVPIVELVGPATVVAVGSVDDRRVYEVEVEPGSAVRWRKQR